MSDADKLWNELAPLLRKKLGFAPLTPEEADAVLDAAVPEPLTPEQIEEMVRYATGFGTGSPATFQHPLRITDMSEVYICPECNVFVFNWASGSVVERNEDGKVWHRCGDLPNRTNIRCTMIPASDPRFVAEIWPGRYIYCPACRRWAVETECSLRTGHWWHLCGKDEQGRILLSPAQVIHRAAEK